VIKLRHEQASLWGGLFAKEVAELWEPWIQMGDESLEDQELVDTVYEAQGQRHTHSRQLGTSANPGRSGVTHADSQACAQLEL